MIHNETVYRKLDSISLPTWWHADISSNPFSPQMIETVPMNEWYVIKTGTRWDAREQQESPLLAATENQSTDPDPRVNATDQVQPHRPRSSSDVAREQNSNKNRTRNIIEKLGDKLFCANRLLETKTRAVTQALTHLEEFIHSTVESKGTLGQAFNLEEELKSIQGKVGRIETIETEAWGWTARVSGEDSRSSRAAKWTKWYRQIQLKIQQIKKEIWRSGCSPVAPAADFAQPDQWAHHGGQVEKVKLPQFNGNFEDYSEFKSQFQQLCQGEGYSPVLELAQLRANLPTEAVTAIIGQLIPERAWERLDELYGNKETSVVAVLKRLRNFKCTKSSSHDQVLEIVAAVQRCQAVLEGMGEIGELYVDRETIASVVQSLPRDSRERWYH